MTPPPIPFPPAMLGPASRLYAAVAGWRRRRVKRHPELVRHLRAPVVSVGNLAVGGTGKTPVVACIATLLRDAGERPAILTRGYGRVRGHDGVVVVRTAERLVASLDEAGDEPLMLARALEGVTVVVAPDRHLAGCVAESRLGCTVHVLDDGFQHVQLARDVDLLLASAADLRDERVLPAGRLREGVDAARAADAWLVVDGISADIQHIAGGLGIGRWFEVHRALGEPRMLEPRGAPTPEVPSAPVLAVAGIARPQRFFEDLAAAGWNVAATEAFPDHHPFSRADVERVEARRRDRGVNLVVTTEKDLVRWLPLAPLPFALAWVPLHVHVEPEGEFQAWLFGRISAARQGGRAPVGAHEAAR